MVVLQDSGSPIQAPAALLDPLDYRQTPTCLKMLPKRYINVHQWLGPVCPKELKAQLVSHRNLLMNILYRHISRHPMVKSNYLCMYEKLKNSLKVEYLVL